MGFIGFGQEAAVLFCPSRPLSESLHPRIGARVGLFVVLA